MFIEWGASDMIYPFPWLLPHLSSELALCLSRIFQEYFLFVKNIPQLAPTPLFQISSLFVKNIPLLEASDQTHNDDDHELWSNKELQTQNGPCVNFMKSMHHQFGTNGNGWRWIRFYARRRFWFLPSMPAGITARMEEASFLDWGIAAG